ncbi:MULTISPECIES: Bug family tripartite tricarboxylate transporter substrate binding protein [Achromobacter]|uniref:Tripartite tricarboxylate transporter substrate binding protein n=1 Tax=Achromobacter spanius TaxID=217203 RepID=A0ABY8GY10_9BURK|nr:MULTISPECIES: tripartite tricarboxylate transporter substrate binding protein [Achromobacter]WAI81374.1 tripartite tricarboxylate transporter substrate binding protein [Achromobacter spanius]WEX96892.1 tripartite tricarboxylate transporter substrate binding protein [Achromobacter sp. SS2-2022]WFP09393.1 tripartite tricarboxylate transporter substrate binding protein [Achromobacter spanius]
MHRTIFRSVSALALSAALIGTASAAAYPDKPITFVVPSAAGGSPDVLSRLITTQIAKDTGATMVIENRPGAAGNIGISLIKRAAADGYTVGYGNINTLAVNRSLFKRLPYDVDQDLTPVAHMFDLYNALIVPAESPVKSVQDLIDRAKKEPGRLSYGASGVGTTGHMGGELFKSMAKVDVMFIPYNGGPAAIQDLLGGRLDYLFVNTSEAAPLVASGKVRAIGVSSLKRLALMPDVPTLDESGLKGYETVAWGGVVAPKGTPPEVVTTLNAAIQKALQAPEVRTGLATLGAEPATGSPQEFKQLIDRETAKWKHIIDTAGIEKLD